MSDLIWKRFVMTILVFATAFFSTIAGAFTITDSYELLTRKAPENGFVDTQVESYTVLAPGTGGLGSVVCSMCMDQMVLYDDILLRDVPLADEDLPTYYKMGQVGLCTDALKKKHSRSYYPDKAFEAFVGEMKARGYDRPVTYTPPDTLVAAIDWDAFHVPHIVGDTIEDVSYGLGVATVYTNFVELEAARLIGRSGILQTGADLFDMDFSDMSVILAQVTSVPRINYTSAELLDTFNAELCSTMLGEDCEEFFSAFIAYCEGINNATKARYPMLKVLDALGIPWPEWGVADSVAVGMGMAQIFGDPGANEVANIRRYRRLKALFGHDRAMPLFNDLKLRNMAVNPETVTLSTPFNSPVYADGSHAGEKDRFVDENSIAWLDQAEVSEATDNDAAENSEKPSASNWIVVSKERSVTGTPLMVGGPQMAYIRPNIFMEFDARTQDNTFQITGVSLPGLFIVAFAGNGHNGVWSPTSATGKTCDIFVEKLVDQDGYPAADPKSKYYLHQGEVKKMRIRKDSTVPFTVHGPVIGWDTVDGAPAAIVKKSYNMERMMQTIFPFYQLAKGKIRTAEAFVNAMQHVTLAINYGYINESEIAHVNCGLYPVRAEGAQIDFPTWGTGEWDWQGVISLAQRPHAVNPSTGYMTNWNNQSAPGFYDGEGDFQRVQMLYNGVSGEPEITLPELCEVAQTAAVQDGYALFFLPAVMNYLAVLPEEEMEEILPMTGMLTDWVENKQAVRIDRDNDGFLDDPGPAIMDQIMQNIESAIEGYLHFNLGEFDMPSFKGSAYQDVLASRLLMVMNRALETGNNAESVDEYGLTCGDGTFESCRGLIVDAVKNARLNLLDAFGTTDMSLWLKEAATIKTVPLETTWRWQNRPTFQQVATVH